VNDVVARLEIGERVDRGRRADRALAAAQRVLAEQFVMAHDDGLERFDHEALVHVAQRQMEAARNVTVDLLDDLGDALDLGRAFAVEVHVPSFLGPADQVFQRGLVAGPE
jgi:hypothetical protein